MTWILTAITILAGYVLLSRLRFAWRSRRRRRRMQQEMAAARRHYGLEPIA